MKKKYPHSMTLVCHADSAEALILSMHEAIDELEEGLANKTMVDSGILQGGGDHSLVQGFYTPPHDFDFEGNKPDSPDLPAVELSDDLSSEIEDEFKDIPKEIREAVEALRAELGKLFPGAQVEVHKISADEQ